MVWGAISCHGRSNLLRIEGNLNNNRYVHEVFRPKVVPFFQYIPGGIFQQDNAPHMLQELFETSVHPSTCNFFFGPRDPRPELQKMYFFCVHTSNIEFKQTFIIWLTL
ncbi:uncharacterized protein TNCV_912841 [Trichonephila clavipes]|nr:uncharacterized protein TNCV_912841 [Trichonephila clavipes]